MDDEDLRHSEMMGVLRTEDDIRARVFGYVRERFVCGGGFFRRGCRQSIVIYQRTIIIASAASNLSLRVKARTNKYKVDANVISKFLDCHTFLVSPILFIQKLEVV
jgi:hypothetical protein